MTLAPQVGHSASLAVNEGTSAAPSWTDLNEVGDVNITDFTMGAADVKTRAVIWGVSLPTMIQPITAEFQMPFGLDETNWDTLRAAAIAGTINEWWIGNGDVETTTSEGWVIPMFISQFPLNQSLEEAVGQTIQLRAALMIESSARVNPRWYVVT